MCWTLVCIVLSNIEAQQTNCIQVMFCIQLGKLQHHLGGFWLQVIWNSTNRSLGNKEFISHNQPRPGLVNSTTKQHHPEPWCLSILSFLCLPQLSSCSPDGHKTVATTLGNTTSHQKQKEDYLILLVLGGRWQNQSHWEFSWESGTRMHAHWMDKATCAAAAVLKLCGECVSENDLTIRRMEEPSPETGQSQIRMSFWSHVHPWPSQLREPVNSLFDRTWRWVFCHLPHRDLTPTPYLSNFSSPTLVLQFLFCFPKNITGWDSVQYTWPVFLKTDKVVINKERLRNGHKL